MEPILIAVGVLSFSFGTIGGIIAGTRHTDLEAEKAYLAGHVDGYEKALFDLGEV
ncbi:MAG TPA: hypothetical protein VIG24_16760 [Acidimicrobiia bacterium]